jgi:branched-chain amino acid transport system substrate-binding protein
MPEGVIIGARGDAYFLQPELRDDPKFKGFVEAFRQRTGTYPIYPVFHMANAFAALTAAFEKAAAANGGAFPSTEQVAAAMAGLKFQGEGRPVVLREDHQGVEDQIIGVTKRVADYPFPIMDQMLIFPGAPLMTPVGQVTSAWLATLTPALISIEAQKFNYKD